jgi:hypothetical protein
MGGGSWTTDVHAKRAADKKARGVDTFEYSATAHATGRHEVHENLDPKRVAGDASPFAGKVMRESCDSDEHPESLPIAVLFDVTGSMGAQPRILQQKLPKLYGMLMEKGYVEHPQILFGAIGDAFSDRVPLQIGQFESDNRADEDLENIFIESGGGGGNHESYDLAAYFMLHHTNLDSLEKRGKKGYLFIVGDERVYKTVDRGKVADLIGDTIQEDLDTKDVFALLQAKYDVYYMFVEQASYKTGDTVNDTGETRGFGTPDDKAYKWAEVLGQNAIVLEDTELVCEAIALTIGLQEGIVDIDTGLDHLLELGTTSEAAESVGKALATVGASAVTSTAGSLPDADGDDGLVA